MFSVVIPLYNKAHTISKTLNSVLCQEFQDFEVVIVDDGSTDDGVNVIKKFTNDPRVRIISQSNKGVSAARNKGIISSVKNYIAFIDGDDEWKPQYLKKISEAIQSYKSENLFLCGRTSHNMDTGEDKNEIPETYKNKTQIIEFFHNPHVFAHISSTVVNRKFIVPHIKSWGGFLEGQKSNEDFVFLFRTALHSKVVYCGYPLSVYNGNIPGQATSTLAHEKRLADSILFHNKVMDEWRATGKQNKAFKLFMRYEIRHILLIKLKFKDYIGLTIFLNALDPAYKSRSYLFEWKLYQKRFLRRFAILFILYTKLIWRSHGFPHV